MYAALCRFDVLRFCNQDGLPSASHMQCFMLFRPQEHLKCLSIIDGIKDVSRMGQPLNLQSFQPACPAWNCDVQACMQLYV